MLYFIRHGQTNHNLNKLLAGKCDIELNEVGVKQAKEASYNLKNINLDIIFCSPLKRARQTCSIINEGHSCPVVIDESLIERDFGIYESKDYSCIDGSKAWNYYLDAYKGEMETLKEVFERVYNFLNKIKEEYKDKHVLIVAHNDIGRAIYCYFNGIPLDGNVQNISSSNASVSAYDFKEKYNYKKKN